jgi:Glycosyltransferase family 87
MAEETPLPVPPTPPRGPSRLLLAFGLLAVLALGAYEIHYLLNNPTVWPPDDFVEYYAAGRLNANGLDPYDPDRLLPLERAAGRDTDEAVMMWNPPWTLTVAMPFGLLPARVSQLLWLALNLGVVLFCTDWAWRHYGGPRRFRWVAWALAFTFMPTYFVLQSGQIGPLVLLGAVGFLAFREGRWGWLAGAACVLLAIKPHLVYLFWLALLLWSVRNRRWSILAGGVVAGAVATAIPLACNPLVLHQFGDALGHRPPEQWVSLTLGAVLRYVFGAEKFWLQFVPTVFGLAWFVPHWLRQRKAWDWSQQLPLLLLVSFLTASYGAWPFDLVILLLPVAQAAVWAFARRDTLPASLALAGYLAINAGALAMTLLHVVSFWFIWMAPALLVGYLLLRRLQRQNEGGSVLVRILKRGPAHA